MTIIDFKNPPKMCEIRKLLTSKSLLKTYKYGYASAIQKMYQFNKIQIMKNYLKFVLPYATSILPVTWFLNIYSVYPNQSCESYNVAAMK